MKNKWKIALAALAISISAISHTVFLPAINTYATASDSSAQIMPMSDRIIWRYKNVKSVIYKRLYNVTREKWIGKWIKA